MPTFRVTVRRTCVTDYDIVVGAEDANLAEDAALERAEDDDTCCEEKIVSDDLASHCVVELSASDPDIDGDVLDDDNFDGNDDHIAALKERVEELRKQVQGKGA
jgi:hypothetical protein